MDERVMRVVNHEYFRPSIAGAVGLIIGASVGYIYGKRQGTEVVHVTREVTNPEPHFEATVSDIEEARRKAHPSVTTKKPRKIPVEDDPEMEAEVVTTQELGERLRKEADENADALEAALQDDTDVVVNVFEAEKEEGWDWEAEKSQRDPSMPYVIHQDEFINQETEFTQTTVTWYEGDDILADSEDVPVYGYDGVIGELKFGHGSDDPNAFYVRNERLKGEYEVLKDPGHFSQVVLGMEAEEEQEREELKHSRNLRFRPDD